MFPNLRLIIGASVATLVLVIVIVMVSGLFSLRDPQHGVAGIPDVRGPMVQRAIVAPADPQIQALAYARRSDELQRLLELPASPERAAEPPATQSYPFVAPADDPPAGPDTAPVASETPSDGPPAAGPEVVASLPTASAEVDGPGKATETSTPPASENSPEPAAASEGPAPVAGVVPDAPAATEDAVLESPIPAIERAPLPRVDPRGADAGAAVNARPAKPAVARAKPRRLIRTARVPARRAAAPIAEPAEPNLFDGPAFPTGNQAIQ